MRFSDFANILHVIQGGQKHAFTRELLSTGLDPEGRKIVTELPDDESGRNRLRKYLAGTRDITEIAVQIQPHFEKELFMECMEDWEDHFEQIRTEFEKEGYTIKIDDVPQTLAEIYHDILLQAATGKNQESSAPSTNSQILLSDSVAIIQPAQNTKDALKQLLLEINLIWNKLTAPTVSQFIPLTPKDKDEYMENMFTIACQHYQLNLSLKSYVDRYQSFSSLKALFEKGFGLDEEMQNLWKTGKPITDYPNLKAYWDKLNVCLQEVDKLTA